MTQILKSKNISILGPQNHYVRFYFTVKKWLFPFCPKSASWNEYEMGAVCLLLTVARSEKFCSIRMTFFLSTKINICDLLTSMKCLVRQKNTNKLMKWDYLWILVSEWDYRAVFQSLKKSLSTICRNQHRIMYPYFFNISYSLKKNSLISPS